MFFILYKWYQIAQSILHNKLGDTRENSKVNVFQDKAHCTHYWKITPQKGPPFLLKNYPHWKLKQIWHHVTNMEKLQVIILKTAYLIKMPLTCGSWLPKYYAHKKMPIWNYSSANWEQIDCKQFMKTIKP